MSSRCEGEKLELEQTASDARNAYYAIRKDLEGGTLGQA